MRGFWAVVRRTVEGGGTCCHEVVRVTWPLWDMEEMWEPFREPGGGGERFVLFWFGFGSK